MTDLTSVSIETTSGTLTLDYLEDSGILQRPVHLVLEPERGGDLPGYRPGRRSGLHRHRPDLERLRRLPGRRGQPGHLRSDIPAATITVEYTESTQVETNETDENGDPIYETQETPATFVLELGDYDGDTCYARISGSSMVYRVDGTVADTLLAAKGRICCPKTWS